MVKVGKDGMRRKAGNGLETVLVETMVFNELI